MTADAQSTLDHFASRRGVVFVKPNGSLAILVDPVALSVDMSEYRPIGQVLRGYQGLAHMEQALVSQSKIDSASALTIVVAKCSLV